MRPSRIVAALSAALALAGTHPACAERPARDPLLPLVRRMDRYLQQHEVDGVTMDSRYDINPSEAIRMSVVCQILGYVELYRARPTARYRREIVEHTDYLIGRLNDVRSWTPFDGMLGDCLWAAYATTREARFLPAAQDVADELLAIPTGECILNGGLMVAMAMAEDARVTGDPAALAKAHAILAQLPPFQNADGSFPHWCGGTEDIHYTGWMSQELILLGRMIDDPVIEQALTGTHRFLEDRVDDQGRSHYEGPCTPDDQGCTRYYTSRASGCSIDYDTRGWTVEPGYTALLFDHAHSAKYLPVMRFLVSLENRGTFPDLWDYWPPPDDPEYPWTIADTSVANMSIIFWSMATIVSGRAAADPGTAAELTALDADPLPDATPARSPQPAPGAHHRWSVVDSLLIAGASPWAHSVAARAPRPITASVERAAPPPGLQMAAGQGTVREGCTFILTLNRPSEVVLTLHDLAGRRVRVLRESLTAGTHLLAWDARDAQGRTCMPGTYFAVARAGPLQAPRRVLLLP